MRAAKAASSKLVNPWLHGLLRSQIEVNAIGRFQSHGCVAPIPKDAYAGSRRRGEFLAHPTWRCTSSRRGRRNRSEASVSDTGPNCFSKIAGRSEAQAPRKPCPGAQWTGRSVVRVFLWSVVASTQRRDCRLGFDPILAIAGQRGTGHGRRFTGQNGARPPFGSRSAPRSGSRSHASGAQCASSSWSGAKQGC